MGNLYLFDIDGTLLASTHGIRFVRSIQNVHGITVNSDRDFGGYTDYLIVATMLKDEGWTDEQIQAAIPRLLEELEKVHKETFRVEEIKLIPGVQKLLAALHETDNTLGLVTGNLKTIAKRKLTALGIWKYFSVGGFGSDPHTKRGELVTTAITRAGFEDKIDKVYVIGDTPRDIEAAQQAGVTKSVGVANGFREVQELADAGAYLALADFKDTKDVLKKLDAN